MFTDLLALSCTLLCAPPGLTQASKFGLLQPSSLLAALGSASALRSERGCIQPAPQQ